MRIFFNLNLSYEIVVSGQYIAFTKFFYLLKNEQIIFLIIIHPFLYYQYLYIFMLMILLIIVTYCCPISLIIFNNLNISDLFLQSILLGCSYKYSAKVLPSLPFNTKLTTCEYCD